jgi:hypothetical protein
MRRVITLHGYSGEAELAERRVDQLGLPLFDIFLARAGDEELAYVMAGDQEEVLGGLAEGSASA